MTLAVIFPFVVVYRCDFKQRFITVIIIMTSLNSSIMIIGVIIGIMIIIIITITIRSTGFANDVNDVDIMMLMFDVFGVGLTFE